MAGLAWARGLVTGGSPSSGRLEVADTPEVSLEAGTCNLDTPFFGFKFSSCVCPFSSNVAYMSATRLEALKPRFYFGIGNFVCPRSVDTIDSDTLIRDTFNPSIIVSFCNFK